LYNSGKIRFTILVGYNIQKITWRPNIQHGIILITLALIAVNEIIIHFVLPASEWRFARAI
jgi:hypothetical protein